MVNFADAVTKVSYGKLRTVAPNNEEVAKVLKKATEPNMIDFLSTKDFIGSSLVQDASFMVIPNSVIREYHENCIRNSEYRNLRIGMK